MLYNKKKQEQYNNQSPPVMYNNKMVSRPPFNRSTINHNKSLVINNNTMTNVHKPTPSTTKPTSISTLPTSIQQQRPSSYTTFNKTLVNSTSVYTKPMTLGRPPSYSSPHTKSVNKSLVLNKSSSSSSPMNNTLISSHNKLIPPSSLINKPVLKISHNKTLVNNSSQPNSLNTSTLIPSASSFIVKKSKNKKIILRNNKVSSGITNIQRHVDSKGQIIVTIDGVSYITKGKKLVRQDTNISNNVTSVSVPKILVRKVIKRRDKNKNLVIGRSPIIKKTIIKRKNLRSKKGNMILIREPEGFERQGKHGKTLVNKATVLKQHHHNKIPFCGTFTRYGKCPNPHCRFRHDQQHVAICPVFLLEKKRKCPFGNHCRLSHQPSPFNLPRCIHFQRLKCKQDPCPFLHVRVDPKAPLCRSFAIEGYCSKGNTCKNKHILVCPNYTILGKCDKIGCRLPHVDSTNNNKNDHHQQNEKDGKKSKQQWIRPELRQQLQLQQQQLEKDNIKKSKNQRFQNKSIINTISTSSTTHMTDQNKMDVDNRSQNIEKGENGEELFIPLFDNNDDGDYWNQYLITDNDDLEEIKTLRFNNDEEDEEEDDDNNEDNDTSEGEEEDDDEEVEEIDNMDEDEEEQEGEEDDEDNEDGEQIVYEVLESDDDDESIEEIYEEVSDNDDLMVYT